MFEKGIALPKRLIDPKMVPDEGFKYQKVFGEGRFIAAGYVHIPVGEKKPGKNSKDNAYVGPMFSSSPLHGSAN